MQLNRKQAITAAILGGIAASIAIAGNVQAAPTAAAKQATVPRHLTGFPQAGLILTPKLTVRANPKPTATIMRTLPQFRPDYRPTVVLAIAQTRTRAGLWLKIELPMRPNGHYGWIHANSVQTQPIAQKIVISRGTRTLKLYQHNQLRYTTKIAVGRPGMETPLGSFYIQAAYKATEPALGAYAFETSAYSKLSDWPGGGIIGIHGTPNPQLLGQAISHGCIRISNTAALTLKHLTHPGTPIQITP